VKTQMNRYRPLAGVRERIIIYCGILSFLVSGGLLLVLLYGAPWLGIEGVYHLKESEIVRALENAADVKKRSISTWLYGRRTELSIIANSRELAAAAQKLTSDGDGRAYADNPDSRSFSDHLRAVKETMPGTYDALFLVSPDNTIAASSNPGQVGRSYPFPEFARDAFGVGATEQIGSANGAGHPLILISRQIAERDRDGRETGEVVAVIIAQTMPQRSLESLALLPGLASADGTYMILVGSRGELLASVPELAADAVKNDPLTAVLALGGVSRTESSRVEMLANGRKIIATYRFVPIGAAEGWGIAMARDQEQAFAPLTSTMVRAAIFGLSMIVIALIAIGFAAGRIARPIRELRRTVSALEEGDFAVRAETGKREGGEISELAAAFNSMAQRMGNWHLELEHQVAERTKELRREKDTAQRYLDVAGVMLILIDWNGSIRMINKTGASILGCSEAELLGRNWFDNFLRPEDAAEVKEVFAMLRRGEAHAPEFHENKVLTCTKGERLFSWHNILLFGEEEKAIGVLSSGEDITLKRRAELERSELERQLLHTQKLESLGVLAGGIAHDFNNLLMVISGNLELVRYTVDSASVATKYIDNAFLASKRAADLTRQMLAYSGKGGYCVKLVDLNRLVGENADLLKASMGKGVVLSVQLQPGLPQMEADPGQMQQVIMNLITNASEAMGEKGGTIKVTTGLEEFSAADLAGSRLEEKPLPGQYLYVRIADGGCGMDAETRERLFDPFFTTKFTGRGLGLSAVLGIIKGHAGAIFVDTEPGAGSTITVLFPVPEPRAGASGSGGRPEPAKALGAGTVLIVDDDEMVRMVCREMLQGIGYHTLLASDGSEAVALFRAHAAEITMVIMDLSMPQMDGLSAAAEIRRIRSDIGMILSSGYSVAEAARRMAGHEGAFFIQKPYELESLRQILGRCSAG